MPDVSVPWGREQLAVSLPEHWELQHVAQPDLRAAPDDWADRLAAALTRPVTGPPLPKLLADCRAGRVVLIVEDMARQSPLPEILRIAMREIEHAGISSGQVEIIFATGMHQPMTPEQAAEKLGPAGDGMPWRCNPWHDAEAYVRVGRCGNAELWIDRGVAAAEVRIIISSVTPHLQAGFGGGYKMLFPGCASLEAIRRLHRLGVGRVPRQLVGEQADRNLMRAAIDSGGQLVDEAHGRTFAVQYLLDAEMRPSFIAGGEVIPTHRMVSKQCAAACGILSGPPADVVITNAFPLDHDLWQSFKCIANTRLAARRNGAIICLTRCQVALDGVKPPRWPLSPKWTRRAARLLGSEAISSLLLRLVPRLAPDAGFFVRLATQTLHRNHILMVCPALCAAGVQFPGIELVGTPAEAIASADALLGGGPQRVVVFPAGGVTFPVRAPSPAASLGWS